MSVVYKSKINISKVYIENILNILVTFLIGSPVQLPFPVFSPFHSIHNFYQIRSVAHNCLQIVKKRDFKEIKNEHFAPLESSNKTLSLLNF